MPQAECPRLWAGIPIWPCLPRLFDGSSFPRTILTNISFPLIYWNITLASFTRVAAAISSICDRVTWWKTLTWLYRLHTYWHWLLALIIFTLSLIILAKVALMWPMRWYRRKIALPLPIHLSARAIAKASKTEHEIPPPKPGHVNKRQRAALLADGKHSIRLIYYADIDDRCFRYYMDMTDRQYIDFATALRRKLTRRAKWHSVSVFLFYRLVIYRHQLQHHEHMQFPLNFTGY